MYIKNIIRYALPCLLFLTAGLLFLTCSDKGNDPEPGQPAGVLLSSSECGGYEESISTMAALNYDDTLTCVDYIYSNNKLTIVHYNTSFNCCPVISGNVAFRGDTIVLNEIESFDIGGKCRCLCLFDVTFEITNLPVNEYVIAVNENYKDENEEPIIFTINLGDDFSSQYCVTRKYYPWGVYDNPQGEISQASDCGGFESLRVPVYHDGLFDSNSCIFYNYTDNNVLQIMHTNAVLNCCPVVTADITVNFNEIIIEEIDSLYMGGCDCICTYDIDYLINDLTPGTYTIKIIEPYLASGEDTLTGTMDLINEPEGTICAIRNNLPPDQ